MVEVVSTIEGVIPLSEHPFEDLIKPKVTEEALSLANEYGFSLVSDENSPVIILAKDREEDKGNKYKVILGEKIEYIEYVWEMIDPYFYYNPRNSLAEMRLLVIMVSIILLFQTGFTSLSEWYGDSLYLMYY